MTCPICDRETAGLVRVGIMDCCLICAEKFQKEANEINVQRILWWLAAVGGLAVLIYLALSFIGRMS